MRSYYRACYATSSPFPLTRKNVSIRARVTSLIDLPIIYRDDLTTNPGLENKIKWSPSISLSMHIFGICAFQEYLPADRHQPNLSSEGHSIGAVLRCVTLLILHARLKKESFFFFFLNFEDILGTFEDIEGPVLGAQNWILHNET